jgi:hypothetical protein
MSWATRSVADILVFCGESEDDLDNYPYANGQLASSEATFAGFDVGDLALGLPLAALPGTRRGGVHFQPQRSVRGWAAGVRPGGADASGPSPHLGYVIPS